MRQVRILALAVIAVFGTAMCLVAQDYGYGSRDDRRGGFSDQDRDAYHHGMQQGREDAQNDLSPAPRAPSWEGDREQRAFEAGYDRAYDDVMSRSQNWTGTDAYRDGMRQGRRDAENGVPFQPRAGNWDNQHDRRAYVAGYNRGFHETAAQGVGINLGGLHVQFPNL